MTKSKNKALNFIILLVLVPMLLLALFVAFPKKEIKSVSAADNVEVNYTFNGSNFACPVWGYRSGDSSSYGVYNTILKFSFSVNSNATITFSAFGFLKGIHESDTIKFYYDSDGNVSNATSFSFPQDNTFYVNYIRWIHNDYLISPIWFKVSSPNFNSNIKAVKFSSKLHEPLSEFTKDNYPYNYVQYIDVNNNTFTILLPFISLTDYANHVDLPNNWPALYLEPRTYYLMDPANFSDNEFYNSGYDTGYNAGYSAGNTDGNTNGYKDGYSAGENIGYGNGYNAGLEQSGKYSFNSLVGAVIDAPVSAFTSLLNFELLGVNILGLVTGLLSLAIIVLIIKLCMGGR